MPSPTFSINEEIIHYAQFILSNFKDDEEDSNLPRNFFRFYDIISVGFHDFNILIVIENENHFLGTLELYCTYPQPLLHFRIILLKIIDDIIIMKIGMTAMTVACAPGHYCPYGTVGANSFPCSSGKQWYLYI